jgi:hypothetical protein
MSVTLTRQGLYDRVWAEPVDALAKEYGLSNVGLGKACRRHDIPVPPHGYWARKAARQQPRRPPLPPAKDGDESVTLCGSEQPDASSGEQDRAVHPLVAFEPEAENKIAVPEDFRVKHPAIAQTKAYWAAQKRGEVPYGDNKLPRLNISVSKADPAPRFRLLQALFNALEQRGHRAAATKEGKTILTVPGRGSRCQLAGAEQAGAPCPHDQGVRRCQTVFVDAACTVRSGQFRHAGPEPRERLGHPAHLEGRQDPAA